MKVSIYNFKGIKSLEDFELNKITILSGANSCGKSSLIQFLLLFKQSIEFGTINQTLILNKPYVSLGNYRQITHNNQSANKFKVKFFINPKEIFNQSNNFKRYFFKIFHENDFRFFNGCEICIDFHYSNVSSKIYVNNIKLEYLFGDKSIWLSAVRKKTRYLIKTNSDAFYQSGYANYRRHKSTKIDLDAKIEEKDFHIDFIGFFPYSFNDNSEEIDRPSTLIRHISYIIRKYFASFQYIGPLREEPKSHYINENDTINQVGKKGEFSAHILARNSDTLCEYYKLSSDNKTFIFSNSKLIDAVKYWLCDVFNMAKNISIDKKNYNSFYVIKIINENSIAVPITHVGFGISQILPIIVAGLRLVKNGVLILEQPEIHLHPKVQSLLFDFLHSLIKANKTIIVETHSDHFITRLRRRIAEDESDNLAENIGLYFVRKDEDNIGYEKLNINNLGNMEYWPIDFFDQRDQDLKEIIIAQQIKKQRNIDESD